MSELPEFLCTDGWTWRPFSAPVYTPSDSWVGTDPEGRQWMTKLGGSFLAYREIVFGRLAQAMGWSCQSSIFIRLDGESARTIGRSPGEIHGAHWLLDEHRGSVCGPECGLAPWLRQPIEKIDDFDRLEILHIEDFPKSELATCLFGGHEPPGWLITTDHEFVILDSELMFSTEPCGFDSTRWWGAPHSSQRIIALSKAVCDEFLRVAHQGLDPFLRVPSGVIVDQNWSIAGILDLSTSMAKRIIQAP
jgi:hypothetical protein